MMHSVAHARTYTRRRCLELHRGKDRQGRRERDESKTLETSVSVPPRKITPWRQQFNNSAKETPATATPIRVAGAPTTGGALYLRQ